MAGIAQGFSLLDQFGAPLGIPTNPVTFQGPLPGGAILARTSVTSAPPEALGTQVMASSTVAAAAAGSVTLPGSPTNGTTYCRGFSISSLDAAAAVAGLVTLTGLLTTLNFEYNIQVTTGGLLTVNFVPGIAASAPNTAIVLNFPAIAGGSATALSIWGVQF
jgi:hypothetical protein